MVIIASNQRVLQAVTESARNIFNVTILKVNPVVESCDIVDRNQSSMIIMGDVQTITNETIMTVHTETVTVIYVVTIVSAVLGGVSLLLLPCCWLYLVEHGSIWRRRVC